MSATGRNNQICELARFERHNTSNPPHGMNEEHNDDRRCYAKALCSFNRQRSETWMASLPQSQCAKRQPGSVSHLTETHFPNSSDIARCNQRFLAEDDDDAPLHTVISIIIAFSRIVTGRESNSEFFFVIWSVTADQATGYSSSSVKPPRFSLESIHPVTSHEDGSSNVRR